MDIEAIASLAEHVLVIFLFGGFFYLMGYSRQLGFKGKVAQLDTGKFMGVVRLLLIFVVTAFFAMTATFMDYNNGAYLQLVNNIVVGVVFVSAITKLWEAIDFSGGKAEDDDADSYDDDDEDDSEAEDCKDDSDEPTSGSAEGLAREDTSEDEAEK
ncbi:MAG: hypothetical protein KAT46_01065 [Deltaproteobacteria bacterium]|nr:hypothetical protein [Deltaproteobacteria bacterium]